MAKESSHEVTQLLQEWCDGNEAALEALLPLVLSELRRLARQSLRHESAGHTLSPTDLVHEAYLRLVGWQNARFQNRAHFLGLSAKLMRNILVDHARSRRQHKRGGGGIMVTLEEAANIPQGKSAEVVALDDALNDLARIDERKSRIVELRYFGGLSLEETAEILNISSRTVRREWGLAQAWLYRELSRVEK